MGSWYDSASTYFQQAFSRSPVLTFNCKYSWQFILVKKLYKLTILYLYWLLVIYEYWIYKWSLSFIHLWINVSKFCTPRSNPLILFDCCSNEPKYCMSVATLLVCIPQSQEKDCPVITGVTYTIVFIAPSNNQLPFHCYFLDFACVSLHYESS